MSGTSKQIDAAPVHSTARIQGWIESHRASRTEHLESASLFKRMSAQTSDAEFHSRMRKAAATAYRLARGSARLIAQYEQQLRTGQWNSGSVSVGKPIR